MQSKHYEDLGLTRDDFVMDISRIQDYGLAFAFEVKLPGAKFIIVFYNRHGLILIHLSIVLKGAG